MTEHVYFDNDQAHVCTDDLDGQRVVVLDIDCCEMGVEDARAIAAAISEAADEVQSGIPRTPRTKTSFGLIPE